MSRCDKPLFRRTLPEGDLEACWDEMFDETVFTLSKNGKIVAEMQMKEAEDDALSVSGIEVAKPADRKKGLGTKMYEQALAFSCEQGKPLVSDSQRSEFAEAFWRKQWAKGRAECIPGQGDLYSFPMRELKKRVSPEKFAEMVAKLPKPQGKHWPCRRYEIIRPCAVPSLAGVKRACKPIRKADAVRAAKKLGVPYSPSLLKGMKVESEHRDIYGCDPVMAARVALAHLRERRDYYDRLEKYVEPKKRRGLGAAGGAWLLPLLIAIPFVPPL